MPRILPYCVVTFWALGWGMSWGHVVQPNRSMHASTVLELFVEERGVRLELELIEEDWLPFADWLPPGEFDSRQIPRPGTAAQSVLSAPGLRLSFNGAPTAGPELRTLRLRNRTRRDNADGMPRPRAQEDSLAAAQVYAAEFWIPFETQPEAIGVEPPSREAFPKLEIGFRAHHDGIEANAFQYLRAPVTLLLDWDDPWHTKFAEPFLVRAFHDAIDLRVFAGEREVRLEAAVRVADFPSLTPPPATGLTAWETSDELRQRFLDSFALALGQSLQLRVNGQTASPSSMTARWIRRGLSGLRQTPVNEPEPFRQAVAGIIWSFPAPTGAKDTTYRLNAAANLFSGRVQRVPVTWEAVGNQRAEAELGPDLATIEWRSLPQPVIDAAESGLLPVPPETQGLNVGFPWAVLLALGGIPFLMFGLAWKRASASQRLLVGVGWAGLFAGAGVLSDWAGPRVTLSEPPMAQAPPYVEAEAKEVCAGLLRHSICKDREGISPFAQRFLEEGRLQWDLALPPASPFGGTWDGRRVDVKAIHFTQPPDTRRIVAELEWTDTAWSNHWQIRYEEGRAAEALVSIVVENGAWRIESAEFRGGGWIAPPPPTQRQAPASGGEG